MPNRRIDRFEPTLLSDREIAATGLGATPAGVRGYSDLQEAVYSLQPQDTADAHAAADAAQNSAQNAQDSATAASDSASVAQKRADNAYALGKSAYDLADTKVTQDVGLSWAPPTGTASRAAFATYESPTISNPPTQAEVQALADALQAHSRALKAVIDDLRANHALTP